METLCGKGGGWRRIASLNMTDPNEKCPTQFRTYSKDGVRACGRPVTNSGSCVGITLPSRDIKYSQVCGKVIGYRYLSTDGNADRANRDINSAYIDGISLTHGNPRKHIWTLVSGYYCPCYNENSFSLPSFVGSNYYCEAGCHYWCLSNPLWDGKGCGSSGTNCCQRTLIPWFYRSFGYSTTDNIEMRICCDQRTSDEDVLFGQYEIYVMGKQEMLHQPSYSILQNSLTNISDQLKGSSNGVSESLSSVTSLFQLSFLKELIGSYKEKSSNSSNEEGLALLKRIELILNTSTADLNNKLDTSTAELSTRLSAIEQDIPSVISSLQSQVSSLSSDLNKLSRLLAKHVNVTLDDEEGLPSPLLFSSCDAILSKWPNSPSGYYSIINDTGHTRHVYCHMETLCGKGGGWRRIASLNMTDPNEKCPTQFRTYSKDGVRACGRPVTNSGSCVGITLPSRDIKYSQ
uniref:Fibrinogen C-terminal domain-containing protein n=1 Tax=Amphimedon queenslandica TaxID=400682 RepID=A0A1X7SSY1_AMPQE